MDRWTRGAALANELNDLVKKANEGFNTRITELEKKQQNFAKQSDMT